MGIIMNAAVRRRERPEPIERTWARREFRDHTCKPGDVRSFQFRRWNGSSDHWFGLTWTPGHLSLVGDIGELVLTHYSALREFEPGIRWAANSSYDYLMEKSDKREDELDVDSTVKSILSILTDESGYAIVSTLGDRREHRADVRSACDEWERAMAAWDADRRVGLASEDERPRLSDELPEPFLQPAFSQKANFYDPKPYRGYVNDEVEKWHCPEGWEGWLRLMIVLEDDLSFDDPNELLRAVGRREVKAALEEKLSGRPSIDEVANLCHELGLDDYYGSYRYKPRTIWQIEAIQHGCNMIFDQIEPKRTWGKTWGDPVV